MKLFKSDIELLSVALVSGFSHALVNVSPDQVLSVHGIGINARALRDLPKHSIFRIQRITDILAEAK